MKQLITLFSKEWREWKSTLLITLGVVMLASVVSDSQFWYDVQKLVIMFILASSLYRERQNRTILYLKSFPVRNWKVIVAKLLFALTAQLALLVCAGVFHVLAAIIRSTVSNAEMAQVGKSFSFYLIYWAKAIFVNIKTLFLPVPMIAIIYLSFSAFFRKIHPFIISLFTYIAVRAIVLPRYWIPTPFDTHTTTPIIEMEIKVRPFFTIPIAHLLKRIYIFLGDSSYMLSDTAFKVLCFAVDFAAFALLFWGLMWLYQKRMNTA